MIQSPNWSLIIQSVIYILGALGAGVSCYVGIRLSLQSTNNNLKTLQETIKLEVKNLSDVIGVELKRIDEAMQVASHQQQRNDDRLRWIEEKMMGDCHPSSH